MNNFENVVNRRADIRVDIKHYQETLSYALSMRYRDEKFYWTYQHGVHWPNDYIGPDSVMCWIIEKSVGFTDVGLLRVSESVRAYACLIFSSQASARSSIIENMASSLTA